MILFTFLVNYLVENWNDASPRSNTIVVYSNRRHDGLENMARRRGTTPLCQVGAVKMSSKPLSAMWARSHSCIA